jgi:hypothetical protein
MCRIIFRQTKIRGKIISAIEEELAAGELTEPAISNPESIDDLSVKLRVDLVAFFYPVENLKRLLRLINSILR